MSKSMTENKRHTQQPDTLVAGRPEPHTVEYYDWQAQNPPDPADPNDTMGVHGYCALFCIEDTATQGAAVEQHGRHCGSAIRAVEGVEEAGPARTLLLYAEQPYHHGVTHRAELQFAGMPRVAVEWDGGDEDLDPRIRERQAVYLSTSEARAMARYLTWFADVADGLTGDPNTSVAKRVREDAALRAEA